MSETTPRVSVIIPTYNRAHCLARAIDSVLRQTFADFELIVVDDGSKDNTRELLEGYGDRIQAIYQSNQGVSTARNTGLKRARGELVAFLDSDDEWLAQKLERQVKFIDQHPEVSFVACLGDCYEPDGSFNGTDEHCPPEYAAYQQPDVHQQFLTFLYSPFPQNMSRYMFRLDALRELGGFDRSLHGSEDWEMFLRLLQNGRRFGFVPELLVTYHLSNDGISLDLNIMLKGDEVIRQKYIETLKDPWVRWSIRSKFLARRYFATAMRCRDSGIRMKSARLAVQSLLVNPFYPKPVRRLKWLASLTYRSLTGS